MCLTAHKSAHCTLCTHEQAEPGREPRCGGRSLGAEPSQLGVNRSALSDWLQGGAVRGQPGSRVLDTLVSDKKCDWGEASEERGGYGGRAAADRTKFTTMWRGKQMKWKFHPLSKSSYSIVAKITIVCFPFPSSYFQALEKETLDFESLPNEIKKSKTTLIWVLVQFAVKEQKSFNH